MVKKLFKIGGTLPKKTTLIIEISGFISFILIWWLVTHSFDTLKIEYNVNNGKEPYEYQWTGPYGYSNITSEEFGVISNLKPGLYNVTLIDSLGEKVKTSIEVSQEVGEIEKVEPNNSESNLGNGEAPLGIRMNVITSESFVNAGTLPSPGSVFSSYNELLLKHRLVLNAWSSIKLNIFGYIEAIALSLLVGFIIGLVPFFSGLWSRYIDAIRFIPLAAVTGLFIAWFGLSMNMKVQFLAFGIFVFLVPVVVQRIKEVDKIYLQTSYTLGASNWQTIRKVYWPHVTSRIIDDVRVLTAISWTYIIVAETLNKEGGVGGLLHNADRGSRLDMQFAILLVIVLIGFLQDLLFRFLDKWLFPHKYQKNKK